MTSTLFRHVENSDQLVNCARNRKILMPSALSHITSGRWRRESILVESHDESMVQKRGYFAIHIWNMKYESYRPVQRTIRKDAIGRFLEFDRAQRMSRRQQVFYCP